MFGLKKTTRHWVGTGMYEMQVAGTSYRHEVLKQLAQNPVGKPGLVTCLAMLRPTPIPEDPSAVAVHIEGTRVGYVPRDLTPIYRDALLRHGFEGKEAFAAAVITNGLQTEEKVYNYTVELDIDLARWELRAESCSSIIQMERHPPYPKLAKMDKNRWCARVWIPVASIEQLHRELEVGHWTAERWSSVNFYVSNRQGIGLGFKIFELPKAEFERTFGSNEVDAKLSDPEGRWATLTLHNTLEEVNTNPPRSV